MEMTTKAMLATALVSQIRLFIPMQTALRRHLSVRHGRLMVTGVLLIQPPAFWGQTAAYMRLAATPKVAVRQPFASIRRSLAAISTFPPTPQRQRCHFITVYQNSKAATAP